MNLSKSKHFLWIFSLLLTLFIILPSHNAFAEEEEPVGPTLDQAEQYIRGLNLSDNVEIYKAIVQYCAENYDYNASASSAEGMVQLGGGDCWASTDFICQMSERFGIEARSRHANREAGAGSGHYNAIARINGSYYVGEAGYNSTKPRYWHVTEEPYGCWITSEGALVQYDGFDDDAVIPEKIGDITITEIGCSDYGMTAIAPYNRTLRSIQIPKTVTKIAGGAFLSNTALEAINVSSENATYKSIEGVVYSKDGLILVQVPLGKSNFSIPDGVQTIASFSFSQNENITHLVLPSSVKEIKEGAFYECSQLQDVLLPQGLQLIEEGSFNTCGSLTFLTIPGTTQVTGDRVFAYSGLKTVYTTPGSSAEAAVVRMDVGYNVMSQDEDGNWVSERQKVDNPPVTYLTNTVDDVTFPEFNYFSYAGSYPARWRSVAGNPVELLRIYANETYPDQIVEATVDGIPGKYFSHWNTIQKTSQWRYLHDHWYYFGKYGIMQTGWQEINNAWYYLNDDGTMATGWQLIHGRWFYLQASGAMQSGWLSQGNTWYYFDASGAMATGWRLVGNNWYYFDTYGSMREGWLLSGNTWYYFNGSGAMETGWNYIGGNWYYFSTSGAMQTGWLGIGSAWYYLSTDGSMQTGWLQLGNTWYYLSPSGQMATGTSVIYGQTHLFSEDGVWRGQQ